MLTGWSKVLHMTRDIDTVVCGSSSRKVVSMSSVMWFPVDVYEELGPCASQVFALLLKNGPMSSTALTGAAKGWFKKRSIQSALSALSKAGYVEPSTTKPGPRSYRLSRKAERQLKGANKGHEPTQTAPANKVNVFVGDFIRAAMEMRKPCH